MIWLVWVAEEVPARSSLPAREAASPGSPALAAATEYGVVDLFPF